MSLRVSLVRFTKKPVDDSTGLSLSGSSSIFSIRGAPSVILETVKRGEDDDDSQAQSKAPKTVILRIYESLGGHARATLRVAGSLGVSKAFEANLLEDELSELQVTSLSRPGVDSDLDSDESMNYTSEDQKRRDVGIPLQFHGFEVKTVKLVLGNVKTGEGLPGKLE